MGRRCKRQIGEGQGESQDGDGGKSELHGCCVERVLFNVENRNLDGYRESQASKADI